MGRTKAAPTKNKSRNEDWVLEKPLDYIPVRVKKNKKVVQKKSNKINLQLASEEQNQFHLGQILIGTTHNIINDSFSKCTVTFLKNNNDEENNNILIECDSINVIVKLIDTATVKALVNSNIFAFQIIINSEGEVFFEVYFIQLPLVKFNNKISASIKIVFNILFNITADENNDSIIIDPTSATTIDELFKNVKKIREQTSKLKYPEEVTHLKLKPCLRPYQQDAVRWMLHRERETDDDETLHPLYVQITLKTSGITIYYDKYNGHVELFEPLLEKTSKGGILADEMGLGKTVEVLACLLMHSKRKKTKKNGIISDDDDDNEEDSDIETTTGKPVVEKFSRKRKHFQSVSKNEEIDIIEEKRAKVPDGWVKGNSKKTPLRLQLEKWYNTTLQSAIRKPEEKKRGPSVQCVCGNNNEEGTVICHNCNKIQHKICFGYNQRFGDYLCPQCWADQPLLESQATLIVTPLSLRTQWCNEICKHIMGDFRILEYEGTSVAAIYPTKLLEYDVVITSYSVLQAEFRLTEVEKKVDFRHQRKYSPPRSPITRIMWRRLCLDEAQTVETPTSMVSAMAKKLSAHYRWAVTGTPISKQISDLHGLIDYLQMEPYNDKFNWDKLLYEPYLRGDCEPMHKFLAQVMWRSSKDDILDQINIPKQEVIEHWLSFSAIEQYFYKMEHNINRSEFLERINKQNLDETIKKMNKQTLKSIMLPLVSLRQVCSFPNSFRTRYLSTKKPVNSMKELLEALIAKNVVESEEFLRVVLSSLNGLAGIYILIGSPEEAISQYREVLQLYTRFTEEKNEIKITIDKLPIIHTMYNLAELLDVYSDKIEYKTLRDDKLKQDCHDLERKYIAKFANQSLVALQEWTLSYNTIEKLQNSFQLEGVQWYYDALNWIFSSNLEDDLQTKITNAHTIANVADVQKIKERQHLLFLLNNWDEDISSSRITNIDFVKSLFTHSPEDDFKIIVDKKLVDQARDCHLRPIKQKGKKTCQLCLADSKLKDYEYKLFTMSKRNESSDASLKGSWKPRSEELIFKSIVSVTKRDKIKNASIIHDGEVFVNIVENLKKEFKELRKLWTFIDQQVSGLDELDICKIRLQVKNEEEKSKRTNHVLKNLSYAVDNKLERINLVRESELEYHRVTLMNERYDYMAKLEKNLGIRSYLQTLNKQYYEGQTPDPCPICHNNLEKQWSIISCGHSYCLDCIQNLIKQTHTNKIQCSVCRVQHLLSDISYIKQGAQDSSSENELIKGNYSTKIEGVIKLILDLKSKDKHVKILIFSTWIQVLKYLEDALRNNNILYELLGSSNISKHIEIFKTSSTINVLLLPIKLGGKGLNLIEATHVVLIEPLLNRGEELQAIGRVHRIGQTKPTFVHKFYIKNTLEETIFNATNANAQNWEKNKVTLRQLMDLFTEVNLPKEDEDSMEELPTTSS